MRKLTFCGKFWISYLIVICTLYFMGWQWAHSAELSLDNTAVAPSSYGVFAGTDYRIKLSTDNYFASYEQLKICPAYCGINYTLVGIGLNRNFKFDKFELYTNIGAFYVKNNVGFQEWNESIYYYMASRFGTPLTNYGDKTGYRVDNSNGYGAEIGARFPFGDNYGVSFYYRNLQFFTNYIMYFPGVGYWHSPETVHYNGYGAGIYYNF